MKENILQAIPAECPWRDTLYWYDRLDSTNTQAKALARQGAPQGTILIAGHQTAGRGRMGRVFQSPEGAGVYLSLILRPNCPPTQLMHLTCAVGVAMAQAVENAAGILPGIKWINDLVWEKKKLGGILTELSLDAKTGLVDYAVVGVGINCTQKLEDFSQEIRGTAASLSMAAGKPVDPAVLAGSMVTSLWNMAGTLLTRKQATMDTYRKLCVTLGQPVMVIKPDGKFPGKALTMDDDGGLLVAFDHGHTATVSSGEVSVRGFYDYI